MLGKVRQAVGQLPKDQRSVLALVSIDGRSYREAADILGIPIGTVMSRLARARVRLAEVLSDVMPEPPAAMANSYEGKP